MDPKKKKEEFFRLIADATGDILDTCVSHPVPSGIFGETNGIGAVLVDIIVEKNTKAGSSEDAVSVFWDDAITRYSSW